jgi:hypothetical protein
VSPGCVGDPVPESVDESMLLPPSVARFRLPTRDTWVVIGALSFITVVAESSLTAVWRRIESDKHDGARHDRRPVGPRAGVRTDRN